MRDITILQIEELGKIISNQIMQKPKVRKIQYNINYVHILTFSQEYRKIIAPYFAFDNLRYTIENEGSIEENIRLVFSDENIIIQCKKEGISFLYEGDIELIKKSSGVIKLYFDIYEKVAQMVGFARTLRHSVSLHSTQLTEQSEIETELKNIKFLQPNPFGELTEFASIYDFAKDSKKYNFKFGNYNDKDISKLQLSPFKTEYNNDLIGRFGFMYIITIEEVTSSPSFTKFKELIENAESLIISFDNKTRNG